MSPLSNSRFWLGIFLTTALFAVGIDLKERFAPGLSAWQEAGAFVLSALFSGGSATFLVSAMLSFRVGRMLMMRDGWVEGHWLWITRPQGPGDPAVLPPGIMQLSYYGHELALRAVVFRVRADDGLSYRTHTEYAAVRELDGRYVNFARIPRDGSEQKVFAEGRFFVRESTFGPDTYEGTVVLSNEGLERTQYAYKIPHGTVKKWQKDYGQAWMGHYLKRQVAQVV